MTTKIRALPIMFLLAILASTVFVACSTIEAHAAPVARCRTVCAGGGRTQPHPCATSKTLARRVNCLTRALAWERKTRRHEASVRYQTSVQTGFKLAEIIYGMPAGEAARVGTCESGLNPLERNSVTATGVMQELDSTFDHTPFVRVVIPNLRIASFDPIVNILAAGYIWHRDGGSWREWDCGYKA